jgi:hypothetical protein
METDQTKETFLSLLLGTRKFAKKVSKNQVREFVRPGRPEAI